MTPEQKENHRLRNIKWREANRDKVRQQAREYVARQIEKNDDEYHKKARETAKRWRENNLEECRAKEKEKSRIRRNKNKDAYNLEQREYRKKNPEKFKQYYQKRLPQIKIHTRFLLLKKYGLTQKLYDEMLLKQKGKCALCDKTFSGQINIDHDHKSGKVRGLLCSHCNTSLGYIEKCIIIKSDILDKITEYLKIHSN